ncbi:MAG TPA: lipopolysaccharide kinase InaA family protein [Planctomycetaceae bacterium]|nr:lipopolysaccharide kinase InaA family protein [Planctomycetaceae bacterium]
MPPESATAAAPARIAPRPDVESTGSLSDGCRQFALEHRDNGRLLVNAEFAGLLRHNGLTIFDAIDRLPLGTIARQVGPRVTARLDLIDPQNGQSRGFFIKKHGSYSLWEWMKPLFRLTRPILGARNEWEAMLSFHRLGIPTMVPVALGESASGSFVLTEALEGRQRVDHWLEQNAAGSGKTAAERRQLITAIAQMARTLHRAGLHHQDLYLCHFLMAADGPVDDLRVIDLGRVDRHGSLGTRWVVKDLAQLHYSAGRLSNSDRMRFLQQYLGRRLTRADRALIRRIDGKRHAIRRHSERNGL